MNQLVARLLIVSCVLAAPATAYARWTRFSSAHFVFVGDASERDMRNVAQQLEQFRDVVGKVFSDEATSSTVPTFVIVFQNDRSFTAFKPVFNGRPVAVAGYLSSSEDVNYMALNAEQQSAANGVVFHEYAHLMMRNAVGEAPLWVNEGLAEFYETFESSSGGKTAMLGKPSAYNLRLLQDSTLLPIAQLTAVAHDSPMYNEGDRRGLFYAESWALVHYLTFGAPARKGQLRKYLSSIAQGTEADAAFVQAFGAENAALERELRLYVRSVGMNALRLEFDDKPAASVFAPGQVISDDEADGYLGDLLAHVNRADDARAYLRRTLERNPEAARATAALGMIELRAANNDAAFPLLERAASMAPGDAGIQSAYGRALTRRADRGAADEEELYARARTVLTRALDLEPDNISTIVTLAEVEMGSGADGGKAVALMQRAVRAAPGREEYRLMLGQALAMNGDYRGASDHLGPLMARGSRQDIRDAARDTLARMATAMNAVRAAAAADTGAPDGAVAADAASVARTPEPRRETAKQGVFVPALRPLQAGETRVLGIFSSVECRPGAIVLLIDASSGAVRLAIPTFNDVEFLTYRQDSPTSVACGPQRPSYRVLATFRTDAPPIAGANTGNRAVAIELLPDDYTPK